ncbi:sugar kinase [Micromonospora sp. BQ11]|uniref:sugar kinase n=1 Tax=Micromonospora sp. BQ11 TaxID=3452212 RepID=UPI003F8C77DA
MTDRPDVVGFGEAMVLLQPPDGDHLESAATLEVHVAGAEFNLCAAVARLGLRAGFCSRVGRDPFGTRLLAEATELGIASDLVEIDPDRPTGLFLKDVRPDGHRRVHYYRAGSAAAAMDVSDAARLLAARPRVVAVSGITAALGPGPLAAVTTLAGPARQAGSRFALDPNLRPALGPVRDQAARLRPLLPYADFLILGVDEAGPLFGVSEPDAVFAAAAAAGAGETVLKAGERGCFVLADGVVVHLPSDARRVVDPVGAGDAFAGGYLAARLSGADTVAAARLGSRLAAAVVGRRGDTAGLPDAATAAALLRDGR